MLWFGAIRIELNWTEDCPLEGKEQQVSINVCPFLAASRGSSSLSYLNYQTSQTSLSLATFFRGTTVRSLGPGSTLRSPSIWSYPKHLNLLFSMWRSRTSTVNLWESLHESRLYCVKGALVMPAGVTLPLVESPKADWSRVRGWPKVDLESKWPLKQWTMFIRPTLDPGVGQVLVGEPLGPSAWMSHIGQPSRGLFSRSVDQEVVKGRGLKTGSRDMFHMSLFICLFIILF